MIPVNQKERNNAIIPGNRLNACDIYKEGALLN